MSYVRASRVLVPPVLLALSSGLVVALMIILAGVPAERRGVDVAVLIESGTLVSGARTGIMPGTTERRTVRLSNTLDGDVVVTGVIALTSDPVDDLGRALVDCLPVVALVEPLVEPLTVPAGGTLDAELLIRLAITVQAECRDLRFPLTYSARTTGVVAGRNAVLP